MNTANYILEQLGGDKFIAASKAKQLAEIPNGLLIKLPSSLEGRAHLKIVQERSGKYSIELFSSSRYIGERIRLSHAEAVYADELALTVASLTGIYLPQTRMKELARNL